jgi:hypothetical protein
MHASEIEKGGVPALFGPNTLVLRFPAEYNGSCSYCQDPGRVLRIETLLGKIIGKVVQLRIELANNGTVRNGSNGVSEVVPPPPQQRRQRTELAQDPLVKRAMEILGAQIVRVDEGFGTIPEAAPVRSSTDEEA